MNFTQLRKSKNFTSVALAAKLGVSQGHLSNMERGKRKADPETISQIASIFNVSSEEVASALSEQQFQRYKKLKSWLSSVRINRMSLLAAFSDYLIYKNMKDVVADEQSLGKALVEFIDSHIGLSVQHELSTNKGLLMKIQNEIGDTPERIHITNEEDRP